MLNYFDFKLPYTRLFNEMRKYVWKIDVLEALANLECAIFRAIFDKEEIGACASALKSVIDSYDVDDENIVKYIDEIIEKASSEDDVYMPLS